MLTPCFNCMAEIDWRETHFKVKKGSPSSLTMSFKCLFRCLDIDIAPLAFPVKGTVPLWLEMLYYRTISKSKHLKNHLKEHVRGWLSKSQSCWPFIQDGLIGAQRGPGKMQSLVFGCGFPSHLKMRRNCNYWAESPVQWKCCWNWVFGAMHFKWDGGQN